ncbi:hypothetical protein BJD55_gp040 [Gordonia phage Yvonnetastic]|uniref:Uncharacterized protein n=1 Tax=Gordonia phage Yvonnetastic TaxID=1821566 RepID=A0A142K9E3_9CAUD|nr:hypothetical protein BJD55_gp040 [Gordonia phage Yvonnetastic]AMS02726.1 hypothetical protein SEA_YVONNETASTIC_182 [Gordonia phage Yvonnetastic]WKW86155.1 hypothetical protein SEA_JONJAMES_182 [Gordonia Phage JonJames]
MAKKETNPIVRKYQELRRSNAAQPIPQGKHKRRGGRAGVRRRAIEDQQKEK